MENHQKVLGIGFQKTATTTLAVALYILGYNVTGYFGVNDENIEEHIYDTAFEIADRFDAVQDTPWPLLYRELDERYPNSKFILTIRDTDRWINSVVKHFKGHEIPLHQWIYGVPAAKGYEDAYIKRYEGHNQEVLDYFKDRPDDLLVMDITKGDGWEKLCPFLGKEIPPVPFPKQNTASQKSRQIFQRGTRFLANRLLPNSLKKEINMRERVNSSYVRDILHYHYEMYDIIWEGVEKLSDEQFTEESPFTHSSIERLLLDEINYEANWLCQLQENAAAQSEQPAPINPISKEDLKKLWNKNEAVMRNYAANMTDEICKAKIPEGHGTVWEAFVDIMNKGIENRFVIRTLLQANEISITEPSFREFFNSK